mmetsp:Transcript_4018/g.14765  ORF Transcript_4018/g.14765 Transcript_4018/m.14765 type:complete len:202 (+) Transcript_4018:81-686(+)
MQTQVWFDTVVAGVTSFTETTAFAAKQFTFAQMLCAGSEGDDEIMLATVHAKFVDEFTRALETHLTTTGVPYSSDDFAEMLRNKRARDSTLDATPVFFFLYTMHDKRAFRAMSRGVWNALGNGKALPVHTAKELDADETNASEVSAGVDDTDGPSGSGQPLFGVESVSNEEHERNEAAVRRETQDGEQRDDLNDLLTISKA